MEKYTMFFDQKTQYYQEGNFFFKLICRVNVISIKIPAGFFAKIDKMFLSLKQKYTKGLE